MPTTRTSTFIDLEVLVLSTTDLVPAAADVPFSEPETIALAGFLAGYSPVCQGVVRPVVVLSVYGASMDLIENDVAVCC